MICEKLIFIVKEYFKTLLQILLLKNDKLWNGKLILNHSDGFLLILHRDYDIFKGENVRNIRNFRNGSVCSCSCSSSAYYFDDSICIFLNMSHHPAYNSETSRFFGSSNGM